MTRLARHPMTSRIAVAVAVGGAAATAGWFHVIENRAEAAWVVPVVLFWGFVVTRSVRADVSLRYALIAGLVVRVLLVGTPPWLSDDLFRYLFEGRVLLEGGNPFLDAPATLAALDPTLAAKVNHSELTSIYPPVAQLWFRLLALVGSTALVAQAATLLVDLVNIALLHHLRRVAGTSTWPALLYALHPLPVLESAHGAHLEPLGVLACLATLSLLPRHPTFAAIAAGLGVGVKLLPGLFVPALLRRLGWVRGSLVGPAVTGLLALFALPVLRGNPDLLSSFTTYSAWTYNGYAYPLLEPWTGESTRRVLALPGVLAVVWAARQTNAAWAWWGISTAFLLLTPIVHPWYALWALPASLVLGRRDWAFAALGIQAGYLVLFTMQPDNSWDPQEWLNPLTWTLAAAGALYARRLARPTVP